MSTTWDPKKAQANLRKHGVRFSDAEAVLMDPNAISRDDPTATDERRFVSVGLNAIGRIVVVAVHLPPRGPAADLRAAGDREREARI